MFLSRDDALPVTIVTGFLGSGKTTLLNRLLRRPALADTAVIVNEFGAVGIDHTLIEQAIENTVLLKNGCICCTVRGDVADTLETLWRQRAEGAIPAFSRLVIETTGLADPGPVAHAVVEPGIAGRFRLDGIVTTVDAMHGVATLARYEEARRQVALADRVFVTKTDLVAEAGALEAAVAGLNDRAPRRRIVAGAAEPEEIFGLGPAGDPERWLHGHDEHDHHHDHHHDHGERFGTVTLVHERPIPWPKLSGWLDSVLSLRGEQVLRLKGIVTLEGEAAPVVLQAVHHVVHPLTTLAGTRGRSEIVLIVDGLPTAGLAASFADALA